MPEGLTSQPRITVIMVVLNGARTVERAILSVITQTYRNVEYIVVDGGSRDGTVDIISKYQHSIAWWVSEADGGLYDAMNKGLKHATGDWIYFLGCDDVLDDCLHDIAPRFANTSTIYYGDVYMPHRHYLYDGRFSAYKLMFANICHQAVFYPRMVFSRYSFDLKYPLAADHALNITCHGDPEFSFEYLRRMIAIFNDKSGHSSLSPDPAFERDQAALVQANFSRFHYAIFIAKMTAYRLKQSVHTPS